MNKKFGYVFKSISTDGRDSETEVFLKEIAGVDSVCIRTKYFIKSGESKVDAFRDKKKRYYVEKNIAFKLSSFHTISMIVDKLLKEEQ